MIKFPTQLEGSRGTHLVVDVTRRLLAVEKSLTTDEVAEKLNGTGFVLEASDVSKKGQSPALSARVNHTNTRFWIRYVTGEGIDDDAEARLRKQFGKTIEWIGPVYSTRGKTGRADYLCPLPNTLLVKLPRTAASADAVATLSRSVDDASLPALREIEEKSKYLNDFHYFEIESPEEVSAYELKARLTEKAGQSGMDIRLENMPMLVPAALVPNDPMFAQQWHMNQIQAPAGWDISTGTASVVICVLDEGCDLTHPDLQYASNGINLGSMSGDGSPTGPHGTACAGIAAGTFNNGVGVTGVAGGCEILPAAFQAWTDVEVAAGINYAVSNGAGVISMSFGWDPWDPAIIDPAIQNAFDSDVVMCVATHNYNGAITYPATNPLVMACGASDQIDERKSPISPDGETWGSDFGPEMSVVAPGVLIATTDIQGGNGYNVDGSGGSWAGVVYPSFGDAAGNYVIVFDGTSAATPHVAGLAGLIRSAYPSATNTDVRGIIERTADKTGATAYTEVSGYDNGTWNNQLGYGRINVSRALDFSDLMIKDWTGDAGNEPSAPSGGNFWSFSDIVVRIFDDDVFVPSDPTQSKHLEIGQTNYMYVRVRNNGPRTARNVVVDARITPYVGTQFVYPHDWTTTDATHIAPTPMTASFASIAPGAEQIAKFSISAAQVQILHDGGWHPCAVTSVTADNDYAFQTAAFSDNPIVVRRNNLAQRNLSLINVLPDAAATFPFVAGHVLNEDRTIELVIDRTALPAAMTLHLALDEGNRFFPNVDLTPTAPTDTDFEMDAPCWEFLEKTRLKTRVGCCDGILTLAKGSKFECPPAVSVGEVRVKGGEVILRGGRRYVEIRDSKAYVQMATTPNRVYPLSLKTAIPNDAKAGAEFRLDVAQRNAQREIVGGASMIFAVE